MRQLGLFIVGLLLVSSTLASQTVSLQIGSVQMVDGEFDDDVFITGDVASCNDLLSFKVQNTADELSLSILMTAKVTGQPVTITYDDSNPILCIIETVSVN